MKRKLNKKTGSLRKTSGFTLIEMLITVAIIGIVVAIAVPALNTAKADAQKRKIQATEAAVATAIKRRMLKPDFPDSKYGAGVTFTDVQEFLLINGKRPHNIQDLAIGTGKVIGGNGNIGQFPLKNGQMSHNGISWKLVNIQWANPP